MRRTCFPITLLWLTLPALVAAPPQLASAPRSTFSTVPPAGLDLAGMDLKVAPGDDFFAHGNGTWLRQTEIPADRGAIGIWDQVADQTDLRTAELIKAAARSKAAAGSETRKIGDYFASFMDEKAIEARRLTPLDPALQAIRTIRNRQDLARVIGTTLRADVDALNATQLSTSNLFGLWVAQDLDQPTHYAPFLLQGGLGMPERSFYLDPSESMATIRRQYLSYVTAMLDFAGLADSARRAAAVVALETRMAQVHANPEDSGDVRKGNHHWLRSEFSSKAPGLDWDAFFTSARLTQPKVFVVWQPSACIGLSALTATVPLATWKDYLAFHALDHGAPLLPKALVDRHFQFHGQVLTGTPAPRPRWQRAVALTNKALGEAIGKSYVKHYFPASEKARAQKMVANILAAFRTRIEKLDWMTPGTKAKAIDKLASIKVGVGYPDRWRDYRALTQLPHSSL